MNTTSTRVNHHQPMSDSYSEKDVWRCLNRHSRRVHIIHGPLAEILQAYPEDYQLRYLGKEKHTTARFA